MNRVSNGRIDIQTPDTKSLFNMYDKIPAHQCSTYRNPLEGQWDDSTLSNAYFSKENIQIIQNGIRAGVYKKSNGIYLVGEQSNDVLETIMSSIFLKYAKHLQTDITGQIKKLNDYVLEYCVNDVYEAMRFHMHYIKDVSTLPVPIALPVVQHSSTKQLELKKWF